ncbi:MAG: type II secretion system protein GspD [Candidatus Melainabacteria bacterium]|nr:type II secretion system protein GspD [Candidatus Melainabacteria bacterium]
MIKLSKKKLSQFIIRSGLASLLFSSHNSFLYSAEEQEVQPAHASSGHCINFNDVPVIEFIRFVSKISEENFIFDNRDLDFTISLSTGKAVSSEMVLQALIQLLKMHGLSVSQEAGYYAIHSSEETQETLLASKVPPVSVDELLASNSDRIPLRDSNDETYEFFVYKLQYHEGPEIEESLKKIGVDLRNQPDAPVRLINAIQSLQWVKATNSLLCSSDPDTLEKLNKLIESLDKPLRQVFIEVLVIETDVKKSMDFGLQWAAGGQFSNKVGFGTGNFAPSHGQAGAFASTMQGINATNTPSGLGQLPLVPGFDLGVIGDIIMHKGKSYLTLGSLVSALQVDGSSTIVLNQKIITQDNKNSTIFVGDNIPFTGSVVQTVGQSQQTTANIEYRDIGVSLSITPRLGEGDVITLSLNEEITESIDNDPTNSNSTVNGIRTTKTNMATHVHVPDKHFLVLSGMIRNSKAQHKAGIPCLGGLPLIGALFSKNKKHDEKRNVIIFVRPHIIHSFEDYQNLTQAQEATFRSQADAKDFDAGVKIVKEQD